MIFKKNEEESKALTIFAIFIVICTFLIFAWMLIKVFTIEPSQLKEEIGVISIGEALKKM